MDGIKEKTSGKSGIKIKKSHKGLLHRDLNVKQGKKLTAKEIEKAEKSKSRAVRKRAVFAANARKWSRN